MKIEGSNQSFLGVKCIGSTKKSSRNYFTKIARQLERAEKFAAEKQLKGEDTFIVKLSEKDIMGKSRKKIKTFVLWGKDAKIPNAYNKTIQKLSTLFAQDSNSDLFVKSLNEQIDAIKTLQTNIATFIAENRVGAKVKTKIK